MSEQQHRVTFHLNHGAEIERNFKYVFEAREYIREVMHGERILEELEDGEIFFIATHQINGAILHPQPVADV